MLTESIVNALEIKCHWDASKPLVVGVSGGVDSIALLHLLKDIGARMIVGHFNHHLRLNALRDAQFVGALCRKLSLPFELGGAEVHVLAEEWGIGVEEAARRARYNFLFGLARQHGAQAVVTAHHADDQVETILMHFLRGSGLDGLAGMPYNGVLKSFDAKIPIFRPLLEVNKAEILSYCAEHGLDYMEDETNQQNEAFRNRLRNELIPVLETYNPNFCTTVLRNIAAIQADHSLLLNLDQTAFEDCLEDYTPDGVLLRRDRFLKLAKPLQGRVIRHAMKLTAPEQRNFSYELLQIMLGAIEEGQTYLPLTDNLALWCVGQQIQILSAENGPILTGYPQLMPHSADLWETGSSFQLAKGWVLHRQVIDREQYDDLDEVVKHNPLHAWVNSSKPDQALIVRLPTVGEAFAPLGMTTGRQKLSDLFINQKIPQPAREKWPLVTVGDSIVWVVGLRIEHEYRLIDSDAPVLHLWAEHAIG